MTQTLGYRDVKAVSNSMLGEFEENRKTFRNFWIYNTPFEIKDTSSLSLGSVVDTYLTRPEDFDKIYMVADMEGQKIAPQMIKFCEILFRLALEQQKKGKVVLDDLMQAAYDETKFGRDTLVNVKKRFEESGKIYFKNLVKAEGKQVILVELRDRAKELVAGLLANPFVKDVMSVKSVDIVGIPIIEVFNQLEIFDEYDESEDFKKDEILPVKGALDKVIVNYNTGIVYPYDIKTSIKLNAFQESYIEYRYFRQASYYTWLLKRWMEKRGIGHFTIYNFQFIVISTAFEGSYIYKVSVNDLQKAETGGYTKLGVYYKGWRTLLNEICWHIKNQKWDYPVDVYKQSGIVDLKLFID